MSKGDIALNGSHGLFRGFLILLLWVTLKYGKWKKENTEEARMEYKKSSKGKETEGVGK